MTVLFEQLEERLNQAIASKRVDGSYLFLGPEGVGKFTFALRFAQALLCEKGNFPPCGKCHGCSLVKALTHPDLHIIELEPDDKQIKIDAIREFEKKLSFRSFQGGLKIGIIHDAEYLNESSQNALLKTLEEPTPDTVLILSCSNRSRLLPTVVSRCQILRFAPVSKDQLIDILKKEHKVPIEKAKLIANLAEGNLEKISDLEHSLEQRKKFLAKWLELRSTNLGEIFPFVQGPFAKNIGHYLNFLFDWYRDLIRVKLAQSPTFNPDFELEIKSQASKLSLSQMAAGLDLLLQMEEEMTTYNLNAQTVGERIFLKLR